MKRLRPNLRRSLQKNWNPSPTFELKVGYSGNKASVTVQVPTANWFAKERSGGLRIWCAPSAEKANSSQSYIHIECKESEYKINFNLDSFENLVELAPITVGGIEMTGREYDNIGMHWIEYYGQIAESVLVSVKLTGVDFSEGTETEALVKSLTFEA